MVAKWFIACSYNAQQNLRVYSNVVKHFCTSLVCCKLVESMFVGNRVNQVTLTQQAGKASHGDSYFFDEVTCNNDEFPLLLKLLRGVVLIYVEAGGVA